MTSKKYYAVKQGRKTGIYNTWQDCKKQVEGYKNAIYKSFSTEAEAHNYLGLDSLDEFDTNDNSNILKAYVDGSFSKELNRYSYGCVLISDKVINLSGADDKPEFLSMRNVAGELLGAIKAIEWAYKNKYTSIILYHDYQGIAKWATGEWQAKKPGTHQYREIIEKYKEKIIIKFKKVDAHSGDKYNDEADRLARKALNNLSMSSSNRNENHIDKYTIEDLFRQIMKTKDKASKNMITYKYGDITISDKKIKLFINSVWEISGKVIHDINSVNFLFDIESKTLNWEVKDKNGVIHKFGLTLTN